MLIENENHHHYSSPISTTHQLQGILPIFMHLRPILCTFQVSVDFYYVPVGQERGGGAGEGVGTRERGIEPILSGNS